MLELQPRPYKDYQCIVANPELLGGKLAIRGTRLTVELILERLSNGMSPRDIDESFHNAFPHAALHEVLRVASEFAAPSMCLPDANLDIASVARAYGLVYSCREGTQRC